MSAPIVASSIYPVRLEIDYPDRPLNRITSACRIVLVLPIGPSRMELDPSCPIGN